MLKRLYVTRWLLLIVLGCASCTPQQIHVKAESVTIVTTEWQSQKSLEIIAEKELVISNSEKSCNEVKVSCGNQNSKGLLETGFDLAIESIGLIEALDLF